ncbi:Protein kinase domain containing protein [Aphelenchoides avenae]|nr:Protein kinase domain containing protein [Aphelenchus avenae]
MKVMHRESDVGLKLIGYQCTDQFFMLVSEYCEAGDMDHFLYEDPDLAVILEAFLQLVIGLDFMHRKGIVHRDLKPCNVFVTRQRTPRGLVDTTYYSRMLRGLFDDPGFADSRAKCGFAIKIGDFGLARFTQQDGVSTGKVGTERYMAPEVRSGKRQPRDRLANHVVG